MLTSAGLGGGPPNPLSVAVADQFRGLGAVAYFEELVGGAQVLLYGGLREVEASCYLGVAPAFDHEFQDLPLTGGETVEARRNLSGYQIFDHLPRGHELAPLGHRDGTNELVGRHPGVDETRGAQHERLPGQRQIQVRTENQYLRRFQVGAL